MFFKKKGIPYVETKSNIIQLDEMGYPLLLCIMSDGTYKWIDVDLEWAKARVESGKLFILEWDEKS